MKEDKMTDEKKPESEKTVKDVLDELTEEQRKVVYFIIDQILKRGNK